MYPGDFYYTKDHEWVQVKGQEAIVGITDFAQKQLGDIVYVQLPEAGAKFSAHQTIGAIESVKAVSDIFSPVSGEVSAVNTNLDGAPELINQGPHSQGWIIKLKLANPKELEALMKAGDYERFVEGLEK